MPTEVTVVQGAQEQPSPTPYIYVVVKNDTFFSIAAHFNISLQALEAANSDVDPRFLIPGTQLLIPFGDQISLATAFPTLTPVAAQAEAPRCYSTAVGELWCFLLVVNESDQAMENLSGVVQFVSAGGDLLANIEAVTPLDILPAGAQMPLVAFLAKPPADWQSAQGQILTGFWLPDGDAHYLEVGAVDFDWTPDTDGIAARVQGLAHLNGDTKAQSVWVLAVAYDASGQVVGVRRWESAGDLTFDFWVYSLGPAINDVQVLVEARP
jgi:murein DD-endopeptidase MepM/ murein hydrolase activator NlpD